MSSRVAVLGTVAGVVAAAAFFLVAPGRLAGRTLSLADDVLFVVLTAAGAAATAAAAVGSRGRRRAAWTVMTVAMAAWLLGDLLWAGYDLRGLDPFPSLADIAYLAHPVLAMASLLLFPTRRSARSGGRPILDGVIVAGSLFIVSWRTAMAQVYAAAGMSRLEELVSLAYPLTSVALLTVASVVLVRSGPGHRLTLWLLTLGLACSAVSSGLFSYLSARSQYGSGHLIDLGWAVSVLLVILAAVVDRNAGDRNAGDRVAGGGRVNWSSVLLPSIPLMLAAVVVALTPARAETGGPVPVVGLIVVAAVLARQFLADRENRRLLNAVADRATHDPLTGLANRAYFGDRLERLADARTPVAVIALDLDGFKRINDTFGHTAGDRVLVEVGRRLQRAVRQRDVVARVGGDEFAILIEGGREDAEAVAARIRGCFVPPFAIDGRTADVRLSLGIAAMPGDGTPASDAGALLERADLAMYAARSATRTPDSAAARSS